MHFILHAIFQPNFDRFLLPTSTHQTPKIIDFPLFFHYFLKFRLSKLRSIFDPILSPTWLHIPSPNRPKSNKKAIPKSIKFLIDFCIDFFPILAPSWDPSWGHVGRENRAKTGHDRSRQGRTGQDKGRQDKDKTRHIFAWGWVRLGGLEFIPSLIGGIPGPWTPPVAGRRRHFSDFFTLCNLPSCFC